MQNENSTNGYLNTRKDCCGKKNDATTGGTRMATAEQRLRPTGLRMYDVTYRDIADVKKMGEWNAPRMTSRMSIDELSYFLRSPGVVVDFVSIDYGTVFF